MKLFKPACILVAASLSYSASAADYNFVAADDSRATKICMSAVKNDPKELKKLAMTLERNTKLTNGKLRVVARGQNCNDMNIVHFASKYGAEKTTKLLAKYLTPSVTVRKEIAQNLIDAKQQTGTKTVVISGS